MTSPSAWALGARLSSTSPSTRRTRPSPSPKLGSKRIPAEDRQLAVYEHRGFLKSMDTYRDFLEFNHMWERHNRPWQIW